MDKEYLKRVLTYVVVSVLAVGVMIYVGYHMVRSFTSGVETVPANLDTFAESLTLDAYILRRENVVNSGQTGTVNYLVKDGEKVGIGDKLADICIGGAEGIRDRIDEIDEKIKELSDIMSSAAYSSTADASNIEARIRTLLFSVGGSVASNDMISASQTAEKMKRELNRFSIVTGKTDGFNDTIEALKSERASLTAQLTNVAKTVSSEQSAYFFYDVDGYESAFAFEDIDKLTVGDIYAMSTATPAARGSDEIGKLVPDYTWYLAVPTDRDTAAFFSGHEGDDYDIVFNSSDRTLSMKLRSVMLDGGAGKAAVIFETSTMPEDFEYTRLQPITVTVRSYTGYRVPLSAVRVVDYDGVEVTGVYILRGSVVRFRRIEIILTKDGYVLCKSDAGEPETEAGDGYVDFPAVGEEPETEAETEPLLPYEKVPYLSLYDFVITSARDLYDGKMISG